MNWTRLALNIPTIIDVAVTAVEHIKSAKGKEKQEAVLNTVKVSLKTSEAVSGKDWMNDRSLDALIRAYIDSKVALQNFLTKQVPEGVIVPGAPTAAVPDPSGVLGPLSPASGTGAPGTP